MHQMLSIDFHDDQLFAVKRDDGAFIAPKPICESIGIEWRKQLDRLKRDPILSEGITIMVLPSAGGPQETTLLRIDLLNGWLFTIDESRVKDEVTRQKVLLYKRECYRVLAKAFLDPHAPAEPTQALESPRTFDEWTPAEANSKVGIVSEYRMSISPQAGQWAMQRLGFPMPPANLLPRQLTLDLRANQSSEAA